MDAIYAVVRGRLPGFYRSWSEVEKQIDGYHDCGFKKFPIKQYGREESAQAAAVEYKTKVDAGMSHKDSKRIPFREIQSKSKRTYYAVTGGKAVGIFFTKEFCDAQLKDCSYQKYKSFSTIEEAAEFIRDDSKEKNSSMKIQFPVESKRVPNFNRLRKAFYRCEFYVDDDGFVQVFTDGSCFENGKKGAKAGAGVYFGPCHQMNISTAVTTQKQSNNVGELQAVKETIRVARICDIKKLVIHSDSMYVYRVFRYWAKDWESNGWMTKGLNKPVENKELIQEICNMISAENIEIKWNYVPAHRGVTGNEKADQLAKAGAGRNQVNCLTKAKTNHATYNHRPKPLTRFDRFGENQSYRASRPHPYA